MYIYLSNIPVIATENLLVLLFLFFHNMLLQVRYNYKFPIPGPVGAETGCEQKEKETPINSQLRLQVYLKGISIHNATGSTPQG
jgi:hypothetical protein